MNAQLVAENIAQQLEKRICSPPRHEERHGPRHARRAPRASRPAAPAVWADAEIARTEHYHEGTIPLQTLRADIEYGFAEAATTYGRIGVKVWIYKGEVLTQTLRTTPRTLDTSKPYQERRERRPRRDGDRRGGFGDRRQGGGFNRDRQAAASTAARGPPARVVSTVPPIRSRPAARRSAPAASAKEGGAQ